MENIDNVRERCEVLAQQMERWKHQTHTLAHQARSWRGLTGGGLVCAC